MTRRALKASARPGNSDPRDRTGGICLAPVDQPTVELIVRLTARLSATLFAAAVILFALGYPHHQRRQHLGARLLAGFIAAHTVHFATVAWLAVVTAGDNIRERDGWAAVALVATLFYAAVFLVGRAWTEWTRGHVPSRMLRIMANVAVAAIAAAFLSAYVARVALIPVYWLPALALAGIVTLYLARMLAAALSGTATTRTRG
jgi:hypothetical protein